MAVLVLTLLLGTGMLGTTASAQAQPAVLGQWTDVIPWPDNGTHMALLPDGKFVSWNEVDPDEFHLWDPVTETHSVAAFIGYNAFCAGFSTMADGKLFVAGGHIDTNTGLPNASIYDPKTNAWTRLPNMNAGRWYPTTTALPNGEMLVTAGTSTAGKVGENRLPQVWQPALNAWRDLTGALRTVAQYPWMFVAPNGKVFMAGPDPVSLYLDTAGTGAWTTVAPSLFGTRTYGSAVMYDEGKVMVSGGGDETPTNTVEVIDLNGPAPAWRSVQSMAQNRSEHNMTLLPDGTVLVTGGSSGPGKDDDTRPVFTTELWDPATEHFTVLAPSKVYRGYHSNALLLPDGRVISLGSRLTKNAQVFSPPYLFKGPRPTITSGPPAVSYGETFTVATPDAASITKVTWLRLGAATHAFNQGQRINRLSFTPQVGGLSVTAPANANLAPPGSYMLFILNDKGVPSVAHMVKVGGPNTEPPPEMVVLPPGGGWKYDDRGTAPAPSWLTADFDDSQWKSGKAGFGAADGTPLALKEGQPTVYFRKKFVLNGTSAGGKLVVTAEDGVAVWLNGKQVLARNLPKDTAPDTWATAPAGAAARSEVPIPGGVLLDGENTVAVMVKRAKPSKARPDPAVRFELQLGAYFRGQAVPVPVLALQAPNGGETLEGGAMAELSWTTYGTLPAVKLEYSADGGGRWESIEASAPNTGSYTWRVPGLESGQVLVRVSGAGGPASADTSDAPLTIRTGTPTGAAPGMACDAAGAGGLPTCRSDSVCLGAPGVCRPLCTADTACASGEMCMELEGQRVCAPHDPMSEPPCGSPGAAECGDGPGAPGPGAVGCSCSSGSVGPSALGLLLALEWALRRRRARRGRGPDAAG